MPPTTRPGCDANHRSEPKTSLKFAADCKDVVRAMGETPLSIVADFYEAGLDFARMPQALLDICEWTNAEAAGLLVHDFEQGTGRFERAVGIAADAQFGYRRLHSRNNPWLREEVPFREAAAVVRGGDIIGAEALKASAFYRNWLRSTGLLHHLFLVLGRRGSTLSLLVLARREGKADFGEDIVQELQALTPILGRALEAGTGARDLRSVQRAVLRAIDTLPLGVVVLDRDGGVIEANPFAKASIDTGMGLSTVDGVLASDIGARRVKLRDLLAHPRDTGGRAGLDDVTMLPVPRTSSQRPLTLLLLPLDEAGGDESAPAALLFIGDPERPNTFDQARIARLYGLSRAESRVAALLASGYRLEQVAERLGIAYETVRKHLKQIFGKTGTFRQAELVRMLVTGPAGLSL